MRTLQRRVAWALSVPFTLALLALAPAAPALAINCPDGFGEVNYSDGSSTCQPLKPTNVVQNQNQGGGTTAPQSAGTGVQKQTAQPAKGFRLQIGSPKNPNCLSKGNCSLDDIVYTGASFAEQLTVLSGALFLVAFIYGGFMYLISAGNKDRVTTGKNAMKTASIGMIIVLGAYTIVSYVVTSLTGK